MTITPDTIIIFEIGPFVVNATIFYTWIVTAILVGGSWLVTRNLSPDDSKRSRWQSMLEALVETIEGQIREITRQSPRPYLPFIGSLFLFISISNLISVVPGFRSPTGSLSTTSALALCVFVAVPFFGITRQDLRTYLRQYLQPTVIMLPFQIISEFSRTLSLAIRLFGNVMSGAMIIAVLISIVPFFLPVVMTALGILIGQIQAYIFAVLATVYIASATQGQRQKQPATADDAS